MHKFLNFSLKLKPLPNILRTVILLTISTFVFSFVSAQSKNSAKKEAKQDSIAKSKGVKADSSLLKDGTLPEDTTGMAADSVKKPKPDIETTINYEAADSLIMDVEDRTVFLYKDAKVDYGKRGIKANTIDMDYNKNLITAKYGTDTTGKKVGVPIFKEGSESYEAGQIKYNYKTRKGQVKETVSKQGQGVIHGEVVRKEPDNNMYVRDAIYTTCDLREPHFCIKAPQLKLTNKRRIVTGPFNLQIDDIPTLIAFPFGIFPIPKKRGSGLMMPSYSQGASSGFVLRNMGLYLALNDYMGLKIMSDIYLNGSIRINPVLEYRNRYSFSGNLNINFSNITTNKDDPATSSTQRSYRIAWSHTPLSKGTGRFSASVNMSSNKFYSNNSLNYQARQQNDYQSSVSYSNVVKGTPFSYQVSARQSQNVTSGISTYNLPTASVTMNQIYPLKSVPLINKLDPVKKFRISYTGSFANNISNIITKTAPSYAVLNALYRQETVNGVTSYILDSTRYNTYYAPDTIGIDRFFKDFSKISNYTLTQSIPISTTIKLFKYFTFTPSVNYSETYYSKQYKYEWINEANAVKVDTLNGFNRTYQYSGGVSTTTRIYGTFFIRKWGMEALRHTMVPTIGYSYSPNFSGQRITDSVRVGTDTSGVPIFKRFDKFTGAFAGNPSKQPPNQTISFSLNNTFELKIRDKKDTTKVAFKKIKLLDNLNASGSYSISSDSFKLSNIGITARTKLLNMFDINFTTTFDPYLYAYQGDLTTISGHAMATFRRRKYYAWEANGYEQDNPNAPKFEKSLGSLGHFVNAYLSISTRFAPKQKKGKKIQQITDGSDLQFGRGILPYYVDWSIPWSLNVSYNMSYTRVMTFADSSITKHNFTMTGDLSFSSKWKISFNTGLDLYQGAITNTNININRDLHCWYAQLSWAPAIGLKNYNYFYFTIGIKAGALADLKLFRNSDSVLNP